MLISPRIRFLFILLQFIIIASSCNWGRTPSKDRFEKNCHIVIPEDVQVLRDEFYDMPPDYAVIYDLKFSKTAMRKLIKSLKRSGVYHITVASKKPFDKNELQIDNGGRAIWKQTVSGYSFSKDEGKTQYRIEIDTTKGLFKAWEGHGG
jgi:hypothetical protein